jgi:hypothetical protein
MSTTEEIKKQILIVHKEIHNLREKLRNEQLTNREFDLIVLEIQNTKYLKIDLEKQLENDMNSDIDSRNTTLDSHMKDINYYLQTLVNGNISYTNIINSDMRIFMILDTHRGQSVNVILNSYRGIKILVDKLNNVYKTIDKNCFERYYYEDVTTPTKYEYMPYYKSGNNIINAKIYISAVDIDI